MKKIRLCIGSNDGNNVAKTHMGDTEYFYIYDIFANSKHVFVEKRINTAINLGHAKVEKMKGVIKIIEDSDVLVARQKSPNFVRIARKTKYQPVVVKTEKISDVLTTLCKSFDEIYEQTTRRKNGEVFDTILEL
jgi:predicted Fe-Mo cluster-binding NifX family protein